MTIANILFDTMQAVALSFLTLLVAYVGFRVGRVIYHFIRKVGR
ncbi:MAG: hypothetical protein ACK5SL_01475 [Cyclobacteriaceae bacterium]|jgi:hypothetical protein